MCQKPSILLCQQESSVRTGIVLLHHQVDLQCPRHCLETDPVSNSPLSTLPCPLQILSLPGDSHQRQTASCIPGGLQKILRIQESPRTSS